MSRQLAVSAAFSVFAMAAFALFASAGESPRQPAAAGIIAGAPIEIEAPIELTLPGLPALPRLGRN